ncbi:MAG: hypothetical protein CML97_01425 [Rhodobiaceae bacterium]|nr:hypothetical protein [Rhodobiaceae bacterium]|tara:strand:- start:767 stop:1243 length:477 start_codon:yes stop_codon:yes gene_type:complete
MHEYMKKDCSLTLAQALDEFYEINKGYRSMADKFKIMRSHDTVHVIFGADTTFLGEAVADLRSMYSTDIGAYKYVRSYLIDSDEELKQFLKSIQSDFFSLKKIPHLLFFLLYSLIILLPRILWDNKKMTKKWNFYFPESYMNESLYDLRKEYNISLIN